MTPQISIHEASHRLHKTDAETFELLKNKAFAGDAEAKFPTVDPLSLDAYMRSNRPKDQLPLIPANSEIIEPRTAWVRDGPEEATIRDCCDRYDAISAYRLEFSNSRRTDESIGKHWYRMRAGSRKKSGIVAAGWSLSDLAARFRRVGELFRKKAGV